MTSRFDFDYWPPRPIEQPFTVPEQSAPSEELCRDLLYIADDDRRRAVYATGDWVDIEDFWVETLREPDAHILEAHTTIDPIFGEESRFRVHGRRHLQNATYTFHRLGFEVAAYDDTKEDDENPLIKTLDEHGSGRYQGDTRAEGFLFHHVFSTWDKRFSNRHVLIARQAVLNIYERLDPLPLGLGEQGRMVLAKVALRWHTNFPLNSSNI